jgi:hypothetical protein
MMPQTANLFSVLVSRVLWKKERRILSVSKNRNWLMG